MTKSYYWRFCLVLFLCGTNVMAGLINAIDQPNHRLFHLSMVVVWMGIAVLYSWINQPKGNSI